MGEARATPAGVRRPATVRVAAWAARHRWPVLVCWFLAAAALLATSIALGGQRAQSIMDVGEPIGESAAGWRVFNEAGQRETTEPFYLLVVASDGRIDTEQGRAAVASIAERLAGLTADVAGAVVPVFAPDPTRGGASIVDPFALAAAVPASAPLVIAGDGTAVVIEGRIAGDNDQALARTHALPPVLEELRAANPRLELLALNNRLVNDDFGAYINAGLDGLLRLTLPITFLILLVAFRALVAALVPLVMAVSTIVAAFGMIGIYSQAVSPVSQYANQIVVLIGLAVAVDYSLFVVSRFRSERSSGRDRLGSIEVASATAGRAVFFSGLAVTVSLSGLFLINEPVFRSIAVGAISVVLIAVVGSLTFLPAVLAILDRNVDRGRLPLVGRERGAGQGVWATVVRAAIGRPVLTCVATGLLLLAVAYPATRLQLGSTTNDVSVLPGSIEGVRAWSILDQKWPRGSNLTLDLIVTRADEPATAPVLAALDSAMGGLGLPVPGRRTDSGDGTVAVVSYLLPGGPNDRANWDLVGRVRHDSVPSALGGTDGTRVYVGGQAAYSLDYGEWYGRQTPLVIAFVLGLSFLLLLVAFHSIVIPIKAIILNLLSAGAAFGVLVLVFQEGWLHGLTGIRPAAIEAWAPVMIFTILFGLSMDYHVFILTRVKEARDRGLSSNEAVVKGITITSGTVTSAAAIMVAVFCAFLTIELTVVQQLGLGLAVAVLVDATLVRSLLLPASMRLLGDWNWWMPRALAWIPRVTIEGESEEVLGDPVTS